jgi:hypothetical protein
MAIVEVVMRKEASFDDHWGEGWPELKDVEYCLADSKGREQFFAKGRDGGCLIAEGLYGTENLPPQNGLVKVTLYLYMNPSYGIRLQYSKWDGRTRTMDTSHSRGNLRRLNEFVRSFHGTPLSLGLFIPFDQGWKATKEFIETEGELPKSIEWIAGKDLPPNTFPNP